MIKVIIYSKVSCIPSNELINFCKNFKEKIDLTHYKLKDNKFPEIKFDLEYEQLEQLYNRKFYTNPVIFIDNEVQSTVHNAFVLLRKRLKNEH